MVSSNRASTPSARTRSSTASSRRESDRAISTGSRSSAPKPSSGIPSTCTKYPRADDPSERRPGRLLQIGDEEVEPLLVVRLHFAGLFQGFQARTTLSQRIGVFTAEVDGDIGLGIDGLDAGERVGAISLADDDRAHVVHANLQGELHLLLGGLVGCPTRRKLGRGGLGQMKLRRRSGLFGRVLGWRCRRGTGLGRRGR